MPDSRLPTKPGDSLTAARYEDVDLFAGAGGWEVGIAALGIRPLGIEWNADACATRIAAGHPTLQADVSELDPLDFRPVRRLIGSPPCPTFSSAGDGNGHTVVPTILRCAAALCRGEDTRSAAREEAYELLYPEVLAAETKRAGRRRKPVDLAKVEAKARRDATMSLLVVEPLRWALALRPESIALEQVPGVLPIWKAFGEMLRDVGYWTWAGKLNAETFGVPQTRERAFLMASRLGSIFPPAPTHQAYEYGVPAAEQHTLEGTLKPWVSMAEALGWGMTERPSVTCVGHSDSGGRHGIDGGSGSRASVERERKSRDRWVVRDGRSEDFQREPRSIDEPAATIGSTARQWEYVNGNQEHAARRPSSAPAPTVHFGAAMNDVKWVEERPATSVMADSRIFQPGGHHEPGQQSDNSIQVTVTEAALLQTFPADYPWRGSRTAIFTQIGNAVPPLMGHAVIAALLETEERCENEECEAMYSVWDFRPDDYDLGRLL